jgi:ribose 1,5-bisphosphate isomerase
MNKQKQFSKICRDIKSIKIQGAENIAKKAFYAYKLIPTKVSRKILISLRPTEPLLFNILKIADKISYKELINILDNNQEIINKNVFSLIKNNSVIYTHCHSSSVVKALIYSKNKSKKFQVYNTETRPLFQGRKTAKELKKANIRVTMFIDSAAEITIKKSNLIFLGADAITKNGVINKIGSGMISDIARKNHTPLYIVSDSLKFTNKPVKIEQRNTKEIWNNKSIDIKNPAFEIIPKNNITGVVSELGILRYNDFLRRVKN